MHATNAMSLIAGALAFDAWRLALSLQSMFFTPTPSFLPTYPLTYRPTYLPTPSYLPTCLPTHLPTYLPTYT